MRDFEKDLINMIYHIKNNRPALYLGAHSISDFWQFVNGFSFGYSFPKVHHALYGFQEFVEQKYIGYKSAMGWHQILLEYQSNDEKKALDLFFEEFELFLMENNIDVPSEIPQITLAE